MKKPKICFIKQDLYLLYKNIHPVGGIEVQQYLLIPYLKKRFEISAIVRDFGQENVEEIDGIKFIKLSRNKRYPTFLIGVIRFVDFWRVLNKADADIYYFKFWAAETKFLPILSIFCRLKKRKFVFALSHEYQVKRRKRPFKKNILSYAIKKSDLIIVQTQTQKKLLKRNHNRESVIIKNGIKIDRYDHEKEKPSFILWLNMFRKFKRPEIFLKLAEAVPEYKFLMVGGPALENPDVYKKIIEKSKDISNLQCIGLVPHYKVDSHYKKAYLYICTSKAEGFPNAFLEAWENKVPVVSLNVDPDEMICKNGLGFHSGTFEQMVKDVRSLLNNEILRREMGNKARLYVERNHDIKKIAGEYVRVFNKLRTKRAETQI